MTKTTTVVGVLTTMVLCLALGPSEPCRAADEKRDVPALGATTGDPGVRGSGLSRLDAAAFGRLGSSVSLKDQLDALKRAPDVWQRLQTGAGSSNPNNQTPAAADPWQQGIVLTPLRFWYEEPRGMPAVYFETLRGMVALGAPAPALNAAVPTLHMCLVPNDDYHFLRLYVKTPTPGTYLVTFSAIMSSQGVADLTPRVVFRKFTDNVNHQDELIPLVGNAGPAASHQWTATFTVAAPVPPRAFELELLKPQARYLEPYRASISQVTIRRL